MNTAELKFAKLMYGATAYNVDPDVSLPIPTEFDFDRPEECARKVFACMSNASGGHPVRDCRLRIDPVRRTANLTGSGVHVFYSPADLPKVSVDEAIQIALRTVMIDLGDVTTDQYGDGWKRAQWASPAAQ